MQFKSYAKLYNHDEIEEMFARGIKIDEINRPLRPRHVEYLTREARGGRLLPTNTIAIAHLNGDSFLVNGQHTLAALRSSGQEMELPTTEYALENEDQLKELYTTYDINLGRSWYDMLRAYGVADRTGLKRHHVSQLGSALKLLATGFIRNSDMARRLNRREWLAPMILFAGPMHELIKATHGGDTDLNHRLMSRGVLSVALITVADNPDMALPFWRTVVFDDGLPKGDPRRALVRFMYRTGYSSGRNPDGVRASEYARVVAWCWNIYHDGGNLTNIYLTKIGKSSMRIKGTRYDGGIRPWKIDTRGSLYGYESAPESNGRK